MLKRKLLGYDLLNYSNNPLFACIFVYTQYIKYSKYIIQCNIGLFYYTAKNRNLAVIYGRERACSVYTIYFDVIVPNIVLNISFLFIVRVLNRPSKHSFRACFSVQRGAVVKARRIILCIQCVRVFNNVRTSTCTRICICIIRSGTVVYNMQHMPIRYYIRVRSEYIYSGSV